LLYKCSVSQLAASSGLSKQYISQVKQGKRPPSERLIAALTQTLPAPKNDYLEPFLASRRAKNCSPRTLEVYTYVLRRFLPRHDPDRVKPGDINNYLLSVPANGVSLSTRHIHYRVLRTFFTWRELTYGQPSPMRSIEAPRLAKVILPSLTREQVVSLIDSLDSPRDKAIVALAVESGLRISELAAVKHGDIDWQTRVVRTFGKGSKEAYAPFGELTESYLRQWLGLHTSDGNVWGMSKNGIKTMLRRLEERSGLPCNPHTFRRTFASLLRKAGVDTMTIKDLGRWESLEMVQRYTRSVSFADCLKHYKAPLG
jgi:site-specific recombinase XerD